MAIKITHHITNGETTTPVATVEVNTYNMAEAIDELNAAGIHVLPAQTPSGTASIDGTTYRLIKEE